MRARARARARVRIVVHRAPRPGLRADAVAIDVVWLEGVQLRESLCNLLVHGGRATRLHSDGAALEPAFNTAARPARPAAGERSDERWRQAALTELREDGVLGVAVEAQRAARAELTHEVAVARHRARQAVQAVRVASGKAGQRALFLRVADRAGGRAAGQQGHARPYDASGLRQGCRDDSGNGQQHRSYARTSADASCPGSPGFP